MAPHPALVFAMVLSIYTGARCIPINLGVFLLAALSPAASGSKPDDVALVAAIMATVIGLCGAPLGHHKGFIDFASKLPASFVSGANIDTDVMTGHVVFWVSVFLAAVTNSPSRRSVSVYSAMVAALFLAPTLFEQNEILYVPLAIIGTPLVLII